MILPISANVALNFVAQGYHRQQNICYRQRCLRDYFEATLDFAVVNLLAHSNISQIVIAVKFPYRVMQLTEVFLTFWHLWE